MAQSGGKSAPDRPDLLETESGWGLVVGRQPDGTVVLMLANGLLDVIDVDVVSLSSVEAARLALMLVLAGGESIFR